MFSTPKSIYRFCGKALPTQNVLVISNKNLAYVLVLSVVLDTV